MGLSSHLPESLKKLLHHKKSEDFSTTTTESSTSSAAATPIASPTKEKSRSPANSIYTRSNNSSVTNIIPCPGYMRDPTRCGSQPDVVGFYNDPMGGKFTLNHGYDCTNTGA